LRPLEALREALTAWRKTKHARFADIAQWATARALAAEAPRPAVGMGKKRADSEAWRAVLEKGDTLDVPRLVKAVGGGNSAESTERIALLSKLNDPRVTTGLLELLGAPPYRARTALPFFRAAAKALQDSGDPRVRSALEELAARYKSILETTVGDDVTALLVRTAKSLDEVKPGPLPPAVEKKCAALEALFETERTQVQRGSAKQKSAKHDDEALLAAIYAAPDDDTPRLVFADALSERGELRGEFIGLQLARAKGNATGAQRARERELASNPKVRAAWSLPLSQGATCHLARGFPDELMLEPRMFKTIIGSPALSTVRTVKGFDRQLSVKQAIAFLTHESAARIDSVSMLEQELVEGLEAPLRWRSVGLNFLPATIHHSRLAKVRELQLRPWGPQVVKTFLAAMTQLEALELGEVTREMLAPLVNLVELKTRELKNGTWAEALAHLPKLKRLVTGGTVNSAGRLEGLKLTSFTCHFSPELDPDAVIAALPSLEHLRVETSDSSANLLMSKLLAAKRLGQLRHAQAGVFELHRPFTPEGTLELRDWNRANYSKHAKTLASLPEGCVSKILLRPRQVDPWLQTGTPIEPEVLMEQRAATKVPVELAWH
jgi:uncharacterized protein (TIGR02996 family)